MEKLRNIRNRLSVSVDKLSPHRRGRSPQASHRQSMSTGTGDIVTASSAHHQISASADPLSLAGTSSPGVPMRRHRSKPVRPNSLEESDLEDINSMNTSYMDTSSEMFDPPSPPAIGHKTTSETRFALPTNYSSEQTAVEQLNSLSSEGSITPTKLDSGTDSLVVEVMKEVQKIESITDGIKQRSGLPQENEENGASNIKKLEDKLEFIDNADDSEVLEKSTSNTTKTEEHDTLDVSLGSDTISMQPSTSEKHLSKSCAEPSLSISSTLHAESLTSGYFSDSTSESSTTTKPKPAATVFATLSNIEDKPPPKKESIYSKLLKRKDKEKPPEETKPKEPLYARIRPKLKLDTSFKPIEPGSPKSASDASSPMLKPEPIYSKVNPKTPVSPVTPSSPGSATIIPGSPRSSFSPLNAYGEPIYSKITPKSSTLPSAGNNTEVAKRESKTFPRDIPLESPRAKYPIYTQPLPALPNSNEERGRQLKQTENFYCGKVTVREKEISPVRANVITISNPVYVPSPPSSRRVTQSTSKKEGSIPSLTGSSLAMNGGSLTGTPPLSPHRRGRSSRSNVSIASSERSNRKSQDLSAMPPPKAPKATKDKRRQSKERLSGSTSSSRENVLATGSNLTLDSDVDSSGKILSRLVEELAVELEAVSRRLGNNVCSDDESKKEVLARLLATYDVPKNLRRVPEVDEDEVLKSEKFLLPISSSNELRLVDENDEHVDTYYGDIPDYSQDEFVIALDDENDPKYASLTRQMRQQQEKRAVVDMSPGKVSSRSAQVYVNVINVLSALKVLVNSNSTRAATVITRMGTLARPYAKKVQATATTSLQDPNWIQRRIYHISGHNGFDDLRRYIKGGGEFCKELAVILQERAELESAYAKGLHKLAGKLIKASRDSLGSVHQAWQVVGQELDNEADVHRVLAASLADEVTRPLRQLLDTQHKVRKGVEGMVDKTTRNVHEWRTAEFKAKKQSHSACRENEKIQDMALEARLGRGKTLSEKEALKMEKQRRKAEELVQRSEVEYYTCSIRAERARLEWESAIYKGTTCFQTLEEERLAALKQLVEKYHQNIKIAAPKMAESASRLEEPVSQCDVEKDVAAIINAKGTGENIPHQLLPDFYAEDINNVMNRDRRLESLEKLSKMFRGDLERERRGKQGVENLAKALQETPNFGGEDSQQDVSDKLQHMRAMLAYLEASKHKVVCSLAELEHRQRPTHPVERHILTSRDKQGMMVSVLKVPAWLTPDSASPDQSPLSDSPADSPDWRDRGAGDGTSVQPDSDFAGGTNLQNTQSKETDAALTSADRCQTCKSKFHSTCNGSTADDDYHSADMLNANEDSMTADFEATDAYSSANDASVNVCSPAAASNVVPKAAARKPKPYKTIALGKPAVVYVSIGNTPATLSRHSAARDASSRGSTLRSSTTTTNAVSNPVLSTSTQLVASAGKSGTLTSNKSSTSHSNTASPVTGVAVGDTNPRSRGVPDGMALRLFLPPIRYPSLPTVVPPDEFSSQGSDRDYQNAVSGADDLVASTTVSTTAHNLVNRQQSNDYVNTNSDALTHLTTTSTTTSSTSNHTTNATNGTPSAATSTNSDVEQTSEAQNPIASIGYYDSQPPPAAAEVAMGRCKALYDYDANMYDELTIRTGDIIQLHTKQPDGWWVGELDGNVGIFPATYVEEID